MNLKKLIKSLDDFNTRIAPLFNLEELENKKSWHRQRNKAVRRVLCNQ